MKIFDSKENLVCSSCKEPLVDYFEYYKRLESKLRLALEKNPTSKLKVKRIMDYYITLRKSFNQLNDKQFVIHAYQKIVNNLDNAIC